MKGQHGLTLIELLLVITVIAILLAVATLSFGRMNQKFRVESSIKEVYTSLMQARNDAALTNIPSTVRFSAQGMRVLRDKNQDGDTNDPGESINISCEPFRLVDGGNGDLIFDRRGFASALGNRTIRIDNYGNRVDPTLNCIVISATRINMGKLNGGNCVQR